MKTIIIITTLLIFFSCAPPYKTLETRPLGKVLKTEIIKSGGALSHQMLTKITTEKMFIVVYGTPSIPQGVETYIVYTSDGKFNKNYFTWDGISAGYCVVN